MSNTHKIVTGKKTYALGAYHHGGKLHSVMVAEIGRYENTSTAGVAVNELDRMTSEPQLATFSDKYPVNGRSIVGPYIEPKTLKNTNTGAEYVNRLGRQYCYPSVDSADAAQIMAEIKKFATSETQGILPDEWSKVCQGTPIVLN